MSAPVAVRLRTRSTAAAGIAAVPPVEPAATSTATAGATPVAALPRMSGAAVPPQQLSASPPDPAVRPAAGSGGDYTVGYGKPPRGRPFAPGHSGNPNGRPKGSKNFHILFEEALNETVAVREKGREQMISKRQVGALRLANKVAEGDLKVLAMLWRISVDRGARADLAAPADQAGRTTGSLPLDGADVLAELIGMALQGTARGTEA